MKRLISSVTKNMDARSPIRPALTIAYVFIRTSSLLFVLKRRLRPSREFSIDCRTLNVGKW
jgi:hypothetical protein